MTTTAEPSRTPDLTVDVVVIGGGPVGENVADRASRTGLDVALVEAELVGGECSYWACMPSKALLRPGAALAAARDVAGLDASPTVDAAAVLAHRDEVTHDWDDASQVEWLEGAGIRLLRGHGRLVGPRLVEVLPSESWESESESESSESESESESEKESAVALTAAPARLVRARHAVVVATGSVPVLPDVPGLAGAAPWGSREATSAERVPDSLVVVGGGVVACEMATAYADLGARVTLLARHGLLGSAEAFAGEAVAAGLRDLGVDVRTGASPTRVERGADGVRVAFTDAQGEHELVAAEVLVATGRVPRTGDVGLDAVGLTDVGRGLPVREDLQVRGVDGDWLYAAGDVTGRVMTTHQGKYEGRVVGDVVAVRFGSPERTGDGVPAPATDENRAASDGPAPWSRFAATADRRAQTQVVFTRPQVASVGLTEAKARDAGLSVRAVEYALEDVSGGYLLGEHYAGTARIVVDEARRVVVGATFVAPDASELLHAATIAVVGEVPLDRLWHAVPAYPTVSEVWLRLLETYGL